MLSKKAKLSSERVFDLGEYTVTCWVYDSPYSWGHYAELRRGDSYVDESKYTYYNRTWETYKYQSIIHGLLVKHGLRELIPLANGIGTGNVKKELKKMGALATMAGLIGTVDTQLKVLESYGLTKPGDWDDLTKEEKKARVDSAISVLN